MHLLECKSSSGKSVKALFNPDIGMNLMSYSLDDIEVIDQNTMPMFEERMAGLGALIGPHFHHRKENEIPSFDVSKLFSFIPKLIEKGQKEFFSHGIARYVPWKYEGDKTSITATLSGDTKFNGYYLRDIEGKSFDLKYHAALTEDQLSIQYSMEADKPSVIGLHYYYALVDKKGVVSSLVDPKYHHPDGWKTIPDTWYVNKNELGFKVGPETEADFGFRPFNDALETQIELDTGSYKLQINYQSCSEENAWQLYHPKDASYVCLEPVSAKNPREAKNLACELNVQLKILTK